MKKWERFRIKIVVLSKESCYFCSVELRYRWSTRCHKSANTRVKFKVSFDFTTSKCALRSRSIHSHHFVLKLVIANLLLFGTVIMACKPVGFPVPQIPEV